MKGIAPPPLCHAIVVSTAYSRWRSQQQEGGGTVSYPRRVDNLLYSIKKQLRINIFAK